MTHERDNLIGHGRRGAYRYALGRHVGAVRTSQEDAFTFLDEQRTQGHGLVYVVSDGMGGEEAGEVASYLACRTVEERYGALRSAGADAHTALKASIHAANAAILRHATLEGRKGMGCTVVALALDDDGARVAHVGDSRAYVLSSDGFLRATRDHTRVQRWVDEGAMTSEEAEGHPESNVLSQALGRAQVVVDGSGVRDLPARDCAWLLCSDGLTEVLPDSVLAYALDSLAPADCVEVLLDVCVQLGASDNVTVVVARDSEPANPLSLDAFYASLADRLGVHLRPSARDVPPAALEGA